MLKKTLFGIVAIFFSLTSYSQEYRLSFDEPQAHYVTVQMTVIAKGGDFELHMPVWAPGSYLVREFSKNVEAFSAKSESGNSLEVVRNRKNAWLIKSAKGKTIITYKVYANELSVRTSFIDADHAYLNGTSIFMFVKNQINLPCTVEVVPFAKWNTISVALDPVDAANSWKVKADNYDDLVDAPFEIGNHKVLKFVSSGVPHEVAMFGDANYNAEKLSADMAKVTAECAKVFGSHPCKRYLFIVHNLTSGGGGLEHKNSTTLQTSRTSYGSESGYTGFMNLVAHEYFHLWNVKRMRPSALGPFDYDNENYTNMLFVSEGFTAYYDDLITRRCGFYSDAQYLEKVASGFSYCMNQFGASVQSVSESSFDAWIKFYRPNENSGNSTVSYYTKGAAVGAVLDMMIRGGSNGKYSLDDVMKAMYDLYAVKLNRGYTDKEFIDMTSKYAGSDMKSFFDRYVYGVEVMPFAAALKSVGCEITNTNSNSQKTYLGIAVSAKNTINTVDRNSPAWVSGLNVNDEIVGIDQYRFVDDITKYVASYKPGDKMNVLVNRGGLLRNIEVKLTKTPFVEYLITDDDKASDSAKKNFVNWLGK
jgi:predicted metalloprotease with PDZ domain